MQWAIFRRCIGLMSRIRSQIHSSRDKVDLYQTDLPVPQLNNNILCPLRLQFSVDKKTRPDIGKAKLNRAVSHVFTKSIGERERDRTLGPNAVALGFCAAVKLRRSVNKQAGCCWRINGGPELHFQMPCALTIQHMLSTFMLAKISTPIYTIWLSLILKQCFKFHQKWSRATAVLFSLRFDLGKSIVTEQLTLCN